MLKKGSEKYYCPDCGAIMKYIGGLLDWECPRCGAEGTLEYDDINKEYYVKIAREYSYEEIYSDPDKNKPYCCTQCDGPYPHRISSCKIFDI